MIALFIACWVFMESYEVIIIGAGAAGLMCAIEASKRGRKVLIIEKSNKPGKKILMSGGGRCNFTNLHVNPNCYLSHNPHFVKSALKRYTQWDFIDMVASHDIPYHEKTLGQLFCDRKSKDILDMLLHECKQHGATLHLNEEIQSIKKEEAFIIKSNLNTYQCESLVVACGGLSIPTLGSSPFGYHIAKQFGLKVYPTRAGLVPLTLHEQDKERFEDLSGVSANSKVSSSQTSFQENILFTHRGLSGPAILQISSYWQPGEPIVIDLSPEQEITELMNNALETQPNAMVKNVLGQSLPKRLIEQVVPKAFAEKLVKQLSTKELDTLCACIHRMEIKPNGTEGYRTAEVTLGGVDCNAVSSKTMEANDVKNLYFVGEVLDVTGWLGGYNFQWAWSSGWAAGQYA